MCCLQAEHRMHRVIHTMNEVMRSTRVLRILTEHRLCQRRCQHVTWHIPHAGTNAKYCQGIEKLYFVIIRKPGCHLLHCTHIGPVTLSLHPINEK